LRPNDTYLIPFSLFWAGSRYFGNTAPSLKL
jgi:hypothetical protein